MGDLVDHNGEHSSSWGAAVHSGRDDHRSLLRRVADDKDHDSTRSYRHANSWHSA